MPLETDRVELTLGDKTIAITESYEVRASVFAQPAAFAIALGHGGIASELLRKYPPNTPFKLSVNGNTVQTGFVDGVNSQDASSGSGTVVTFEGRDVMARLIDAFMPEEVSYQESKYTDLVRKQLDAVGLESAKITASNEANRKAITGAKIVEMKPGEIIVDIRGNQVDERQAIPGTKKVIYATLKAKLGTRRYEFLKTQLDRAGLMLWAAGDGGFIIAWPQADQSPISKLVRQRGVSLKPGTILRHAYTNRITSRFTNCVVYGHGGGRNFGRSKNRGEFVDEEMLALVGGGTRKLCPLVIHDEDAKSNDQADFLARRKIVEANRAAWSLTYVVAGHSVMNGQNRVTWAPDTVVEVDDQELGIKGPLYIEDVTMRRAPETTTTLRLMKPEHVRGLRPQ
jgi:prophage tail gpP-like protein